MGQLGPPERNNGQTGCIFEPFFSARRASLGESDLGESGRVLQFRRVKMLSIPTVQTGGSLGDMK